MQRLSQHLKVDHKIITSVGAEKTAITEPFVGNWRQGVAKKIAMQVKKDQANLIHMQYSSVKFGRTLGSTLIPKEVSKQLKLPVVVTSHEYHDASWLGRKRVEVLIKPVEDVIVSNQADYKVLSRRFPRKNFYVVPIGSNIEVAKFSDGQLNDLKSKYNPGHKKLILTWGLLDQNKGVDKLVEAVSRVGSSAKLLISSGYNPKDQYHKELNKQIAHTSADIDWLGYLSDSEISGLLQICDIVALPFNQPVSLRRGSVLAALAHGKPVITTGPSQDKLLQDRKNCYLLANNKPYTIELAINDLLNDPKLSKLLASGAHELAAHFDWNNIAKLHESIYKQILSRR